MKDLLVLVADKNAQFALKGALGRPKSLGIRSIEFEFVVHAGRDGGARKSGPEMLALERRRFRHALLVFDFEGSGTDALDAVSLETQLDQRLAAHWEDAAKAIVIEPELDVWLWGADNAVESVIDWPTGKRIREWLQEKGFDLDDNGKPVRPKEALEAALRIPGLPRSSAMYQIIAEKLSLRRCQDAAFLRLRSALAKWFSEGT